VPALLLTGALDQKFTAIAQVMAAEMPRAELCPVAGAGHAVHLEDPAAFQAAAADFLRRLHGLATPTG